MFYPYRTTHDKMEQAQASVEEAGDSVLTAFFAGGRDWVLLCRKGSDPQADLREALEDALRPVLEELDTISTHLSTLVGQAA